MSDVLYAIAEKKRRDAMREKEQSLALFRRVVLIMTFILYSGDMFACPLAEIAGRGPTAP